MHDERSRDLAEHPRPAVARRECVPRWRHGTMSGPARRAPSRPAIEVSLRTPAHQWLHLNTRTASRRCSARPSSALLQEQPVSASPTKVL